MCEGLYLFWEPGSVAQAVGASGGLAWLRLGMWWVEW